MKFIEVSQILLDQKIKKIFINVDDIRFFGENVKNKFHTDITFKDGSAIEIQLGIDNFIDDLKNENTAK